MMSKKIKQVFGILLGILVLGVSVSAQAEVLIKTFPKKQASFKLKLDTRERKLVLITGCGRSGTNFMQEYLTRSGLGIGHEHMGKDGTVSWLMGADVGFAPWGPLARDFKFRHVFHQVRNPVKVIQSYYNLPPRTGWDWIMSILPVIKPTDSSLTKCTKYWIYWNKMVELKAEWTYRIEDIEKNYQKLGKKMDYIFSLDVLKGIPKNLNTKGPPTRALSWAILKKELDPELYQLLKEESIRYGYSTPKD